SSYGSNRSGETTESDGSNPNDAAVQAAIEELLANVGTSPVRLDRMLESLRNAEFDIAAGIGELVDNAVEERGKNVWIFVKSEKRMFKNKAVDVVGELAV